MGGGGGVGGVVSAVVCSRCAPGFSGLGVVSRIYFNLVLMKIRSAASYHMTVKMHLRLRDPP